jgi:hypothetical protein
MIFQHKRGVQQTYDSSHQPPGGGKICSEIDTTLHKTDYHRRIYSADTMSANDLYDLTCATSPKILPIFK